MSRILSRRHWQRATAALDPATDGPEFMRLLSTLEFPWDMQQALSLALFRTYAVPSIGGLLYATGEFTRDAQRRHDDTVLILGAVVEAGPEHDTGRAAIRRMNQMHRSYDISNDDMRYVMSTFVVTPVRWIAEFGYRPLTDAEIEGITAFYHRVGTLMGIRDLPATYQGFSDFMDDYERAMFTPDERCRAVADGTLALLQNFYPRPLAPAVRAFALSLLDPHVREAYGYDHPPRAVEAIVRGGIRLRGRLIRLLPARRTPVSLSALRTIRSYPNGHLIDKLGTFPAGMPDGELADVACPTSHETVRSRPDS